MIFKFKRKINFKKRIIFSILFTCGLTALLNTLWFVKIEKHHYDFQFFMFFIVATISFLISFKLSNYLADFKKIKNKSRIDIVFLFVFFFLLFLPMSRIDNSIKSKTENRYLETYKPLFNQNGSINYNFGNDFENFFNDRFFLRSFLISNYHFIRALFAYKYYETNNVIYLKENNFIVSKRYTSFNNGFNKEDIPKTLENLERFQEFCNKNNIKLYILAVPYNVHIFQDEIKPFDNPEKLNILNNNIKELQLKSKTKIIYPFDELKHASNNEMTFFKTDHHWTDYGAYIGYLELMKEIKKDYPFINILKEDDFNYNYSKKIRKDFKRKFTSGNQLSQEGAFLLPLKKKILNQDYKYFEYKNKNLIAEKIIDNDFEKSKKSYFQNGANLKILLMGNSTSHNLLPFLQSSFKNTKFYILNEVQNRKDKEQYKVMKYYKKDILSYKPDIIVFCISNSLLNKINDFFLEEEN